jgi:hypothetical protein
MSGTGIVYPVDAVAAAPSYTGRMLRNTIAPLVVGATTARPLGGISGVRPGTASNIVTSTTTTYTVTPFAGIIDLEAAAISGPYAFAFNANVTGAVTAANASNPRVDAVYVQINDNAEGDGTAGTPNIKIDYLAGTVTVAGTLVIAAVPARSFVIANINVPISGGGSPTVSWVAPYTVAAGGILPVPGVSGYPASSYPGQYIDDPAVGLLRSNGTAWANAVGLVPVAPTSVAGTGVTSGTGGKVTFTTSASISVNGCFTSAFEQYVIVFDIPTIATAGNLVLRLRLAGTDLATSTYVYGGTANNTTATAVGSGGTFTGFYLSRDPVGAISASGEVRLFSPALAVVKRVVSTAVTGNASYVTGDTVGGLQSSAVAYDGFTVVNDAGSNMTGTFRIYGRSNN